RTRHRLRHRRRAEVGAKRPVGTGFGSAAGHRMTRTLVLTILVAAGVSVLAQQPPPGGGQGRGRGGMPRGAEPLAVDDHTGFAAIFDGKTLKGWDGDPTFWRAENGAIVGESTPDRKLTQNTFIIWRGGEPADFELKVEYKLTATNSGIQLRSVQLPAGGDI